MLVARFCSNWGGLLVTRIAKVQFSWNLDPEWGDEDNVTQFYRDRSSVLLIWCSQELAGT